MKKSTPVPFWQASFTLCSSLSEIESFFESISSGPDEDDIPLEGPNVGLFTYSMRQKRLDSVKDCSGLCLMQGFYNCFFSPASLPPNGDLSRESGNIMEFFNILFLIFD